MRITIELSDEDGARFIRAHDGYVALGNWTCCDVDSVDASIVDVDGKGAPQPPECTRVHRTKSKCRLRHHWLPEGIVPS